MEFNGKNYVADQTDREVFLEAFDANGEVRKAARRHAEAEQFEPMVDTVLREAVRDILDSQEGHELDKAIKAADPSQRSWHIDQMTRLYHAVLQRGSKNAWEEFKNPPKKPQGNTSDVAARLLKRMSQRPRPGQS